jgi:putative membrane protein
MPPQLFITRENSASSIVMLLFHYTRSGDLNMALNQRNNTGGMIRNLLINTVSIFAVSYILSGIQVDSAITALVVAVVMAVLNVTLKPLLVLITIPLTIVTFGLFLLVVNVLVLYAAEALIDGFHIAGFWWALAFSLLVSFANSILFGPARS